MVNSPGKKATVTPGPLTTCPWEVSIKPRMINVLLILILQGLPLDRGAPGLSPPGKKLEPNKRSSLDVMRADGKEIPVSQPTSDKKGTISTRAFGRDMGLAYDKDESKKVAAEYLPGSPSLGS